EIFISKVWRLQKPNGHGWRFLLAWFFSFLSFFLIAEEKKKRNPCYAKIAIIHGWPNEESHGWPKRKPWLAKRRKPWLAK
ncbi:MAG: hypothetical protein O4859_02900, partial [Trichodesmium sp. St18_bin1]|nr:hypothetical protein [Trichodesmium sp. St18_bin1]MDE5118610.1 hypothetical protein [Trichodesmium sp. St2_bin2_1]